MKNGFTLPEILAVITIIGAISAFALPSYNKHIHKAQLLEGLSLASKIKLDIQTYASTHSLSKIENNGTLGLPDAGEFAGEYVSEVKVQKGGKIKISYNSPSGSLTLTPKQKYGFFKWSCQADTADFNEFLPTTCKPFKAQSGEENGN